MDMHRDDRMKRITVPFTHKEDGILLVGKQGCSKCEMIKGILNKRNIEFRYLLIEDNPEYKNMIVNENKGMYPLILRNGQVVGLRDVL